MFQFHDLHVHTRPHSPDAHWRATVAAMLKQASKRGVTMVGLANHYFPTTNFDMFRRLRQTVAKKSPKNTAVLVGAELCVLDTQGRIILTEAETAVLDFVLAGPHHFKQPWVETPPYGDVEAFIQHQHQTLLAAARHPLVNGLAHPWVIGIHQAETRWGFSPKAFLAHWHERYFAELGQVARQHQTAIEIGMGIHLMAHYQGEAFWQKYVRGLQAAKTSGAQFYFGSDAHHLFVIARLDWLQPTWRLLGFTPNDIISPLSWLSNSKKHSARKSPQIE